MVREVLAQGHTADHVRAGIEILRPDLEKPERKHIVRLHVLVLGSKGMAPVPKNLEHLLGGDNP